MTSLADCSVLVVGATGGLGAPISRQLAAEGAKLTLLGRDAGRLEALGLDATLVTGDLRETQTATNAVTAALSAHGRLDGLVVASGSWLSDRWQTSPTMRSLDLFLINTLALIRLLQAALPHLVASREAGNSPFVVNLSAVVAEQPTAGMAAYSASKAALTAYDSAAARELRRAKIRLIDARPHTRRPDWRTGPSRDRHRGYRTDSPPKTLPAGWSPRSRNDESDLPSGAFS